METIIKTTSLKVNRAQAKEFIDASTNGIILIGKPGVGKTTLIRERYMVTALDLALAYQDYGLKAVKNNINQQTDWQSRRVIIDDLGLESEVKYFGNGLDPVAYAILDIYEFNQRNPNRPIRLIFTTNLDKQGLTEKYGVRVVDRIWEMCDRLVLDDTNLRAIISSESNL